jgi:hypothetical protein
MSSVVILRQAIALVLISRAVLAAAAPGPLRVSENGRYFVDASGAPFYFLADTQWELLRRYSLDDARVILENRKAKGFTVAYFYEAERLGRWHSSRQGAGHPRRRDERPR